MNQLQMSDHENNSTKLDSCNQKILEEVDAMHLHVPVADVRLQE